MSIIGNLEDAILKGINDAAADGTLGYKPKVVDTYGGELSEDITRAAKDFPAFLLVFNGDNRDEQRSTPNSDQMTWRYIVFCCAVSLRNESSSRKGAGDKVGSYQMAEDVRNLFQNVDLNIAGIDAVKVNSIRPFYNDKANLQLASVYAVDIEITGSVDLTPNTDKLSRFTTFHANWDIPAFADIQPPLPADEQADATDHITLPQEE